MSALSETCGAEITDKALAAGRHVVATAREPESDHGTGPGDQLSAVPLDVNCESQAAAAAQAAARRPYALAMPLQHSAAYASVPG